MHKQYQNSGIAGKVNGLSAKNILGPTDPTSAVGEVISDIPDGAIQAQELRFKGKKQLEAGESFPDGTFQ